MNMKESTQKIFETLFERYPQLNVCKKEIAAAAELIIEGFQKGKKLLVCGNGGSAADSEHIVGELVKSFRKKRALSTAFSEELCRYGEHGAELAETLEGGLPAIALTGHIALSTAFANDRNPQMAFAQQTSVYGTEGDVLIAISTSGNSVNCLYATLAAKAKGLNVILLSGGNGGKIKSYADVSVIVPESETYRIQELHLPVYHALCAMTEEELFD